MIIIGIDPGKKGGWVALDCSKGSSPIDWLAADHPDHGYVQKGRYLPKTMVEGIKEVLERGTVIGCVIEQQQARPMEGRSSSMTTGYGWGLWVGITAALSIPVVGVSGARWTRSMFSSSTAEGKGRAVELVGQRLPSLPLTWGRRRRPHDGLADAACLALYGVREVIR